MSEEDRVGHLMNGVADDIYRILLTIEVATTVDFTNHCRRFEKLNKKRISSVRFEKIPSVATIKNEEAGYTSKDLMRKIVKEELRIFQNEQANSISSKSLEEKDSFHHKPTESTIAAFIDLSQAFDRVWKEKLILKLDELGIEGSILSLISNFLSKRTKQVKFNNIKSKTTRIYQGLPQGSILSLILFNIYLNNLHTFIKPPAKIALYADDIIIWVSKNNLSDAEQSLNKAMKNLQKNFLSPTQNSQQTHLPDNPHKHKTQSELLKALGLQIIEENSSLFDITIYNDGSQLETGLSLSGIAIYKDKILEKISLSHPRHLSVYKSELSAIDTALKDININSPSKIIIYSDSRAAIYTFQNCFSSQEPLLKSIAKSVNRLPANSSVTVQWLPAHVGIPGNELADSLAKAGALGLPEARESTTQLDERDLLRTIKTQCLQEWKSDAAHDWYRAGGTSTGSVLPREQQSLISRLKSGHLRTMTFRNGCKVFPLCTKCNFQPATPRHIIDCIDSSIDELYSSPADTIKNLKLYKLDTLV
ncbi:hypothetical protein LAZ67_13000725 [Cordylochernes scorpioides]|uniref:RNA-directed DNA polymerase from transposon BS n=1 Tax=Cordylochernes scorpioides TaxID=51811 RepID=A0ABY6L390_9ARAC|nr:hypothetical protein LAZ67_13000725 [Cordylochernes scorpioides]